MIVNKEGKLFGKLNIIDLLLLLIVIIVAVFAVKIFLDQKDVKDNLKIMVKLEVTQKESMLLSGIKEGDAVYDHVKNISYGTLKSFETRQSQVVGENNVKGEFNKVDLPDRQDVIFDIEAVAKLEKEDLIINKEPVKIGNKITIRTGNTAFTGFIIGISYDEAEYRRLAENA